MQTGLFGLNLSKIFNTPETEKYTPYFRQVIHLICKNLHELMVAINNCCAGTSY